ncbi:hypothetical protein [Staphylococcus durrellii]|uniref:hypothetical protein n=1 Tax=Staphylococcus durrellii TaxID=2781773 RepID=UPI00189CB344|nr:hypothetical protein [Staphylococcus durrellii]MBF7016916.1 hypothetical protein [Staphylococcus durrellii]
MSLVILLGVLLPVIYLMVKVVSNTYINKQIVLYTMVIAVIGMLISAITMALAGKTTHVPYYFIASLLVGVIWALILCGCYYYYQKLNDTFGNKNKDM